MSILNRTCCDDAVSCLSPPKNLTIALIGNPNAGKTTVFNALTGARQRVGNWSGVTVERKTGTFTYQNVRVEVIDLPGTYALNAPSEASSIDEHITCEYMLNCQADLVVNIVDASNLERNLYLALQLREMQIPLVVAVNMMDVARQRGIQISLDVLAKELGCVVVPLEAHKGQGVKELKQAIVTCDTLTRVTAAKHIPTGIVGQAIEEIADKIEMIDTAPRAMPVGTWHAIRLLEDDALMRRCVSPAVLSWVTEQQNKIRAALHEDVDILLADARYYYIQALLRRCIVKDEKRRTTWTARLDNLVLNRVLGIPIFLGIMYCMFFFAINIGGAFQDFFDIGSNTLFVQTPAYFFSQWGLPSWLTALLANGIGKGINTTITFVPVIGAMFLFLAVLEDTGYMTRAAFVVDRLMQALGLPGKSFVPMIIGFGCNVPAVMAARTLENKRDRILTVMMTPFMSCGARLAIYAVFTAAFFPVGAQNIVFFLYLMGIIMAVLTGLLLRKTVLRGEPAPLIMELPSYHLPHFKTILLHAWQRLKGFVLRAGKLIVPICILLGVLNTINVNGVLSAGDGSTHSLLAAIGRIFTPLFAPMGIHQDNWPATVGLVTGIVAKEVVVGTLNTLYSQAAHLALVSAGGFDFWGSMHEAVSSIATNLGQLGSSFANPVLAKAPVHDLAQGVYGIMYQRFDGQAGAIAYLLFVLLYFPCVSTIAAMVREIGRGWAIFSVFWSTGIAYGAAVGFYQALTFLRHPWSSFCWIAGVITSVVLIVHIVKTYARMQPGKLTPTSLEAA